MSKVTSKLQVSIPKDVADRHGIHPGDEIAWVSAGDGIRVIPPAGLRPRLTIEERLRLFDEDTERVRKLVGRRGAAKPPAGRGWRREDLYARGRPA